MKLGWLTCWILLCTNALISQNIIKAEYFIDSDPGIGNAINISGLTMDDTISFPLLVSTSGLSAGFHSINVRVKNDQGLWSHFMRRTFYISPPANVMPIVANAEYFLNNDPGIGNGQSVTVQPDDTLNALLNLQLQVPQIPNQYYLALRTKDLSGRWSHFKYDTVTIAMNVPSDTSVVASTGICSRIVNMIDALTYNNQPYTYSLSGATTGSGSGSASGLNFNVGMTTVTYTLTDNPNVSDSFIVTVLDNQLPSITCPANIVQGSDQNNCGAIINYTVSFNDNCPNAQLALLSGLGSGSVFPLGPTINTFRVTDASGNSVSCSFTVNISDDDPPAIICPPHLTVNTDPGICFAGNVALGTPVISDNCSIASISNNAPGEYPPGITNVIWQTTDVSGLTSSCVQTITVSDNQPPLISCPSNLTVYATPGASGMIVNFNTPAYSDNCPGAGIVQTSGLPSGSEFPNGTTTNTFVVTAANGASSSCSFTINVRVGRVGINTTIPNALLHVADTNVIFVGPSTLPAIPGHPPQTDSGGRMMWYADKAAFRAGIVDNVRWSRDSIGVHSFSTGYNTLAKASESSAFNYSSVARGTGSTAFGHTTKSLSTSSLSIGSVTNATGETSLALGFNTKAIGNWSTAMTSGSIASGEASFASGASCRSIGIASSSFGEVTRAIGNQSTAFGNNTRAKALTSFVVGRNNDTSAVEPSNWLPTDPLFIVGNGSLPSARANAMTILKNGNVGIFEMTPDFRLHVTNNNGEAGGMSEGILVENTHALTGEAGVSFLNKSIPAAKKWIVGLNQNPNLAFAYGPSLTGSNTKMTLDSMGHLGIKTITPQASFHAVRTNPSTGPFSVNAFSIFESELLFYLQLSHTNAATTGIFSGNEDTTQRSGVQFTADSAMQWTTIADSTRMSILSNGNIGIADPDPDVKCAANGPIILGSTGTSLTKIIKSTVTINVPSMAPNTTSIITTAMANAVTNGTIFISPAGAMPSGLIISSSRVASPGNVEIRFTNKNTISVDPPSMEFYIAHID